jgi:hypothetical protein
MEGFKFQRSIDQYLQTFTPPGTSNPDLISISPNPNSENKAIVNGQDPERLREGANMKNTTNTHNNLL